MSRYAALNLQAGDDLAANPERVGVVKLDRRVTLYPLGNSARRGVIRETGPDRRA